ncbi:ABC transporter ATP-binding protein [Amycolatopsis acidicola]|uniref:ABC transporter ATP-binding protein n=1 Tax=Amycolatopsis acidicola TaxID=2596893 RepID=A0A5N0UYB6_9PSEU|nr:ABC transporter ATP-binding protein [Amycolatopsis acidicola]KAA9158273.1 ABC transporter ATP-binding protein [Amycolatopsis acidicola]
MPEPVLEAAGASRRFGELTALSEVDFTVSAGEAVGVVGPNGAGKTTLLSVLAGTLRPNDGRVRFRGEDVTRLRADRRCRKGIARAYQIPRPFGGMTVLENVIVGATHGAGLRGQGAYQRAIEVLEQCALAELANRRAESLGLLHRKRMELARALATGPAVLLLDEIGGGLTDAEADELVATIRQLHAGGVAIVWIEHIVHVLVQVVDRLVCMNAGRIIADGPPEDVLKDASVIDAYLGRRAA